MKIEKAKLKEIYLKKTKDTWNASSRYFPDFLPEISQGAKLENQKLMEKQKETFKEVFINGKLNKALLDEKLSEILNNEKLFPQNGSIDKETMKKAADEMKSFLRKVRFFAPHMDIEDIGKAARNYMVYSVFNILNGQEQECTDAIFAYSMLYPVTDNFLDDPAITQQEKKQYNKLIKEKLENLPVAPKTEWEKCTVQLLEKIEKDYPRAGDDSVYTVLLCMLEAQIESLLQQNKKELSKQQILDISAYKGGMSVLADRIFVKKKLCEKEICFYLGLGLILQLGDDLQDIHQDITDGSKTLMTQNSTDPIALEGLVNGLLHFTRDIINEYDTNENKIKNALEKTCYQLILFSACESREYFTQSYLEKLDRCLPVTFDFLKQQKQGESGEIDYLKVIDEMISV